MIELQFTKEQCHYLDFFLRKNVESLLDECFVVRDTLLANKTQPDTHVITFNLSVDSIFNVMEKLGQREEKLYGEINRQLKGAVLAVAGAKVLTSKDAVTAYQQAMQAYNEAKATSTEEVPLPTVPAPTQEQITYAQFGQKFDEWEAVINGNLLQEINQSKLNYV